MKKLKSILCGCASIAMVFSCVGMTAFADDTDIENAIVSEDVSYDGVFSEGAEYHFISSSKALIIDGEGSFTAEEFSELASKLEPVAVALQNGVSVSDEWMKSALSLASPYVVYCHYYGKAVDDIKAFREKMVNEAKSLGSDISKTVSALYSVIKLDYYLEDMDFYEAFDIPQNFVKLGQEMTEYLTENGIKEGIAKKVAGCYLFGLKGRVNNRIDWAKCTTQEVYDMTFTEEVANIDGTEINQETIEYIRKCCFLAAETEQMLIEGNNDSNGTLSQFFIDNNINVDMSDRIQVRYAAAAKKNIAGLNFPLVRNFDSVEFPDLPVITEAGSEAENNEAELKENETQTTDALSSLQINRAAVNIVALRDGGSSFGSLADIVVFQRALSERTATAQMDINGDGKVNVFDLVAAKKLLTESLGTAKSL